MINENGATGPTGAVGATSPTGVTDTVVYTDYVYASTTTTTTAVDNNTPITGWTVQQSSGNLISVTGSVFLLAPNQDYIISYTASLKRSASDQIIELGLVLNGNAIQSTQLAAANSDTLSVYPLSGTALLKTAGTAAQTLSVNLLREGSEAVNTYSPGVSAQIVILAMPNQ